jgi:AraC-like DNA-binding protein
MAFNGRFVLSIIQFASMQGLDKSYLLALTEMDETALCNENCKVGDEVYDRLMEHIADESGDRRFGLHMGQHMSLSAAGLIYQIVQSSRTMREALHYCAEFAMLGCSSLPISIEDRSDAVYVVFTPVEGWESRSNQSLQYTLDGVMVFSLREYHSLTMYKDAPIAVHFQREEADTDYLEAIFGCPVLTGQPHNAILLKAEQVDQAVISGDYRLLQLLVNFANEKLEQNQGIEKSFLQKVKNCILNMVRPAFPTIEQVAEQLNMSVRSLQRKLKAEGQTFQDLVESLREDAAKNYLRDEQLSIGEVGFLLGYAEPSAFVRAFKRWTGVAPGTYRRVNSEVSPY